MQKRNRNIADIYTLSPMQQGMLFHSLYEEQSGVYIEQDVVRLEGQIDVSAFKQAWQQIIERHSILRTLFVWQRGKEPIQIVRQRVTLPWVEYDWRGLPDQEERIEALAREERRLGFKLDQAPLMRFYLIRLDEASYQFILTFHHLLLDGWSKTIVTNEVVMLYEAATEGKQLKLPAPRPYRDYILWLRRQPSAEPYWRDTLRGFLAPTPLMVDKQLEQTEVHETTSYTFHLSNSLTTSLQTLAQQHRLTLNTLIQGVWAILLSRYSGEEDVLFGATTSGRPATFADVDSLVGLFINTLPVRVHVDPEAQLLPWLQELQQQHLTREQYNYSALTDIQGWSEVPRGMPLFESILVFENFRLVDEQKLGPLHIQSSTGYSQSHYPLTIIIIPGEEWVFNIEYQISRFDGATIERMGGHLQRLLQGMVENPEQTLTELPLVTSQEYQQLVYEWNQTQVDYGAPTCVHNLFEAQVARTPHAVALIFEDDKGLFQGISCPAGTREQQLTYQELNHRANQLAHYLQSLGVGPETLVGITVERSIEMVVGLLGILKAGGAYVPLDPTYPQERLAFMLQDADVSVLLTQQHLTESLPYTSAQLICLDSDWTQIAKQESHPPHSQAQPHNLAYVIYTSGSTGQPKGAMNSHAGIVNRLIWMQEQYQLIASDRVLQKTPFSFDVSVWEFFWPLMYGATLVVARPEGHKDPQYLIDIITQTDITTIHFVPSMLQLFIEAQDVMTCTSLKRIICSGEALPFDLMQRTLNRLDAELHNLYGPTEAAIDVSHWPCIVEQQRKIVPIGRPIANTQLYIVDASLQPVPIGVAGELLIGGVQVARGYHKRPELTAQKFINNPFSRPDYPEQLYRTSDLARWLPDGNIEFLGRMDHQVKIRGFRIELGEIEAVLAEHPAVQEVVASVQEERGDKRLIAYIIPNTNRAYPVRQLLRFEQEGLSAEHSYYELSNGMSVFYQNRSETDFMYREIFAEASYLRHGITLTEGSCIFDVGANVGLFTLFAHQRCNNATLYAFEPIQPIFELLRLNTALYGVNAKVFNYGLASTTGSNILTYYPHVSVVSGRFADAAEEQEVIKSFLMNESTNGLSDAALNELLSVRLQSEQITCQFKTLSDVMAEYQISQIDLLKIDVEKSEYDILLGIAENDWPKIKQVVLEVHDSQGRLAAIEKLLRRHGFIYTIEQEAMLKDTALYNLYAIRPTGRSGAYTDTYKRDGLFSSPTRLLEDIKIFLSNKLPNYMIPSVFVLLNALPLTPNGKLNRKALPIPKQLAVSSSKIFVSPRTPTETVLVNIWSEVLGIEQIGIYDHFFELGGHSLLAVRLIAQIRQKFGANLPLAILFQSPTVEKLARELKKTASAWPWSSLVPIQPHGEKIPFFCVPGAGGNVLYFYELARILGTEQPFYGLQSVGLNGIDKPYTTIEEAAAHYIEAIQTIQPQGPYLLGGHSYGGQVAFEMAQQLRQAGHEVGRVVILDTHAPTLDPPAWQEDWDDAKWIATLIELLAQLVGQELSVTYKTLRSLDSKSQLLALKDLMERLDFLPAESDLALTRGLVQVYKANNLAEYVPQTDFPVPLTLFRAQEKSSYASLDDVPSEIFDIQNQPLTSDWGWQALAKHPVEVIPVPGDHITMMTAPNIQVLGEELAICLANAVAG